MTSSPATTLPAEKASTPAARPSLVAAVVTNMTAVQSLWTQLEQEGWTTPYQTFAFCRAWLETLGVADGMTPFILTLGEPGQTPFALLPMAKGKRRGITIVRHIGGKHANFSLPVMSYDASSMLEAGQIRAALKTIARQNNIDLIALDHQVVDWKDKPNPLASLGQRSISSAWKGALMAHGDDLIASLMSSESRKKLRHKQKRLAEFGEISYREVIDQAEAGVVLSAFLAQKAERFRTLGLADPFSDASAKAFLNALTTQTSADDKPALRLFAMKAGSRILSVFGGMSHAGRFTGMFTSFDPDPVVSKFSPGDLLLMNLVMQMCKEGLHTFDLGTGDAGYKGDYCPIEEPLVDIVLPITLKGHAASFAMQSLHTLKRRVKQNKAAMKLIAALRRS
jgi:CelD/BcsL family acetyltransferase involved in cellulose biosynthesis